MEIGTMRFITLDEVASCVPEHGMEWCLERYGGKAVNLSKLASEGFCVPPGFVISTEFFESIMDAGLCANPGMGAREVVAKMAFPQAFEDALRTAMDETPARCWAVRSSSTDEDSQTHSFAGLQESVIGVSSVEACLNAIRTVWQSFYARERLLYPSQASLSGPVPSMAVIVQAFVDSEVAGVVFTHHPMEGSRAMLVNVSRGQGAMVVDGKAGESLCIDRRDGENITASECLNERDLRELIRVSLDIERHFGKPQDIEFAFADGGLFILQTRDIVAPGSDERSTLYSNVNVGEALSGVCSPMTWSVGMRIAKEGFETVFGALGLSVPPGYEFVTTFDGHIYLNVSEILSVASQVPFVDLNLIGRVAGIKQMADYVGTIAPLRRRHFVKNLPKTMATIVGMQSRLRHLSQHAVDFCRRRDALLKVDLRHASPSKRREVFASLDALFVDCAYDMLGASGSFLASYVVCTAFLDHFNEAHDEFLESYLFSGLLDVTSAAPGLALLDMANAIRPHAELTSAFMTPPGAAELATFRARTEPMEGGTAFWQQFDAFMQRYGARANQEAELANPRWREDPSFLFRVICTHLKSEVTHESRAAVDTATANRETRMGEFRAMLSSCMRPLFRTILGYAQKNARLREQWRAYVVDVLGLFRKFFLESAEAMVLQGILGDVSDVFYLTYEEFQRWLAHPESLLRARILVAFRRARHEAFLGARPLPDTFVTHPNQCEEPVGEPTRVLYGLPASPGCVRARVRVARTLEEASHLEYGEILATVSTDVGWTPLFLVASAILTERGGPLSHAFVVAREYGTPAVVSIPNLLNCVKTGDIVAVSGQKGIVSIQTS